MLAAWYKKQMNEIKAREEGREEGRTEGRAEGRASEREAWSALAQGHWRPGGFAKGGSRKGGRSLHGTRAGRS